MKKSNKILLVLLISIFIGTLFVTMASAKTYTGTKYGYHSDYIYVHTTKTNAKVPLTFVKGTLNTDETFYYSGFSSATASYDRYGAYEIKIFYWNGKEYVKETSYDVYNKSSNTVTLKRANTDYKIQVYQWRVNTTYDSYKRNSVVPARINGSMNLSIGSGISDSNPFWLKYPKFSTGTLKYCTLYSRNPH